MAYTYIQAIGLGFPSVGCHAVGDGTIYDSIVWDAGSPMPSQAVLDTWIAANPEIVSVKLTVLAFRNRFTQVEKITIEMAMLDNPAGTMQQRQQAAALRASMADLMAATFVDISRPDTIASIHQLEALGVLGAGRADQILSTVVQPIELAKD
jgi:hypothetical protein